MKEGFISISSAETQKIAARLARRLFKSKPEKKAVIIGLIGDLGSGKTIFTKGFAKGLGIKKVVTSPTFVIEKIYKLAAKNYRHLIHIDAYRIEKPREIIDLDFKNLISDPHNIVLVEWADKIKKIMPRKSIFIFFETISEKKRKITVKK